MKHFLVYSFIFLSLILSTKSVAAEELKARLLSDVSTSAENTTLKVRALNSINLGNGVFINKNDVIIGKIQEINLSKKFAHNAAFAFVPSCYINKTGKLNNISTPIKGYYREKFKIDITNSALGISSVTSNFSVVSSNKAMTGAKKLLKEEMGADFTLEDEIKKREAIELELDEIIYFDFSTDSN